MGLHLADIRLAGYIFGSHFKDSSWKLKFLSVFLSMREVVETS